MTLKQKKFIQEIQNPENHLNMAEAMRKAGYSPSTVRAGDTYNRLRIHTQDIFSPEKTKRKILQHQKRCLKANDLTNTGRMIELEARISIPELRKQEIITDNPREITINYGKHIAEHDKNILEPIVNKEVMENKAS